jgi:hypothetical protein
MHNHRIEHIHKKPIQNFLNFLKFPHLEIIFIYIFNYNLKKIICVVTLALGLQPRQGLAKVRANCEGWESHFMLSKVWENVRK